MNDMFEKRLQAAVAAGWWTAVIWWAFLAASWLFYLAIWYGKPDWMLVLWGHGQDEWPAVRTVFFWFLGGFKLAGLILFMMLIYLTIWSRRLRRA